MDPAGFNRSRVAIAAILVVAGLLSYYLLFKTTTTTTVSLGDAPSLEVVAPAVGGAAEAAEPSSELQGGTIYRVGGVEVAPLMLVIAAALALLMLFAGAWMIVRGGRRRALRGFVFTAGIANLIGAYLCIYWLSLGGMFFLLVTAFVLGPLACGFGVSWACSLRGRRAISGAVLLVLVVSAAPVSMMVHPWPLSVAYFVSSSALEQTADDALAGATLDLPRWAGVFRIVDVAVEDGAVALITDPNRSGRSGLVRLAAAPRANHSGPLVNLNWDVWLAARWRYQNED